MKAILSILFILLIAAQCPDCPPHDPTLCDSIKYDTIHVIDSVQVGYNIDSIICDTIIDMDTLYIPVPVPVPMPCPCDTTCPEPPVTDVIFETGFERPVSMTTFPYRIVGIPALPAGITDYLFNISPPAYTIAEIRPDPTNSGNMCLYGEVIGDDPNEGGTSRFQSSLRFNQDFEVYHFVQDVYLSPDIASLVNYSGNIDWFTLVELWEQRNPNLDGDVSGQARWNLGIFKDAGVGSALYFDLHMELMQPASVRFDKVWQESARVRVPLGEWFELDFCMTRGQTGNITVKINGETIFNVTNYTEYPGSPLPIWAVNAQKLYMSTVKLNFIRSTGGRAYAYYDNFKWYDK